VLVDHSVALSASICPESSLSRKKYIDTEAFLTQLTGHSKLTTQKKSSHKSSLTSRDFFIRESSSLPDMTHDSGGRRGMNEKDAYYKNGV
jgi:hypothetical protein